MTMSRAGETHIAEFGVGTLHPFGTLTTDWYLRLVPGMLIIDFMCGILLV